MLNIENQVLTLRTGIWYHRERFQNRQSTLPGRFFVCADPSDNTKEQLKQHRDRERTHSMYSLNQVKTLASCGRDPGRSLPLWRGFLLVPLILICFAFAPQMRAILPPPDGGYPNFNTAEGEDALLFTTTAFANTGIGWRSLFFDTTARFNTGCGAGTLTLNNGESNTAIGAGAMLVNISGMRNTAVGQDALLFNTFAAPGGDFNGAYGAFALFTNSDGFSNNAVGDSALFANISGSQNTAVGDEAMQNSDLTGAGTANFNTAVGAQALFGNSAGMDGDSNNAVGVAALEDNAVGSFNQAFGAFAMSGNVDGQANIAIGDSALANGSGNFNTVVGDQAGQNLIDGGDNIYIGAGAGNAAGNENFTIRIGDPDFIAACFVGGIAGVPVTGDPVVVTSSGQLGIAAAGSPLSMKEVLKEREIMQQMKARIALQDAQIQTLTAALKQQAEQIQKVSAQLEMIRPTPRVVGNR